MAKSNAKSTTKPTKKPVVKKKPKTKSNAGRPTKKDAKTVTLLVGAFHNDFDDTEACEYAGISRNTFYRWLKNDTEFSDKITRAKNMPNKKAKEAVMIAINNGDSNLAFRFLERKDSSYQPKQKLEHQFSDVPVIRVEFVNGKKRKTNRGHANTR